MQQSEEGLNGDQQEEARRRELKESKQRLLLEERLRRREEERLKLNREQQREDSRELWSKGIMTVFCLAVFALIYVIHTAIDKKFEIEKARIARSPSPLATSEKTLSNSTNTRPQQALMVLQGFVDRQAESSEKRASSNAQPVAEILNLIDSFVKAGALGAEVADSLRSELSKAGLNIASDAAKALIEKYIRSPSIPTTATDEEVKAKGVHQQVEINVSYSTAQRVASKGPKKNPLPAKQCPEYVTKDTF